MPLYIDDKEQLTVDSAQLAAEIVRAIEGIFQANRYIKGCTVNDTEVLVEDLMHLGLALTGQEVVQITSCTLDELIVEIMATANDYVPRLFGSLHESVDLIRVGDIAGGSMKFAACTEGLAWNLNTLKRLANLRSGPSVIHELSENGDRVVRLLMEAWQNSDFVLFADILEYECMPWLDEWNRVISVFQSQYNLEQQKVHLKNPHLRTKQ